MARMLCAKRFLNASSGAFLFVVYRYLLSKLQGLQLFYLKREAFCELSELKQDFPYITFGMSNLLSTSTVRPSFVSYFDSLHRKIFKTVLSCSTLSFGVKREYINYSV